MTPVNLYDHINQSGVTYGADKLALMQEACRLQQVPLSDDNVDENGATLDTTLRVKLFNPCGSWSWYIQDWDGADICFGYVVGHEDEWGSFSLNEIAHTRGQMGIGMEIDTWFMPTPRDVITSRGLSPLTPDEIAKL